MRNNKFIAVLLILFTITFLSPVFAQDAEKHHDKKMMKKESGKIMEVACDPSCGFKVQSRNEKELISIVKTHVKKYHKADLTDAQVREKMNEVKE
jgi:predicted small metal-binding protein